MSAAGDLTPRRFAIALVLVVTLGGGLRFVYPTADPPWHAAVGITWHDEGPWVHNARNKVLWGKWSTDRWNPMYLTPVVHRSRGTVGLSGSASVNGRCASSLR